MVPSKATTPVAQGKLLHKLIAHTQCQLRQLTCVCTQSQSTSATNGYLLYIKGRFLAFSVRQFEIKYRRP